MMSNAPSQPTLLSRDTGVKTVLMGIVVLAMIAAMVIPNLIRAKLLPISREDESHGSQSVVSDDEAEARLGQQTQSAISRYEWALKMYAVGNGGSFPEGSSEQIAALVVSSGTDGNETAVSSHLDELPRDPWGQLLHYEWPNRRVEQSTKPAIWSNGPNQQDENGEGDDITNWAN